MIKLFYDAGYSMVHHDGLEIAGYLTFLALLAFFPFLIFLVSLAGFLGQLDVGARFVAFALANLPGNFIDALLPRINEIVSGPPQGLLTLAIVGTIWTASSAMEGIRMVLNRAYRVETPPAFIWRRIVSILQLLALNFLIITAMLFMTFIPVIWKKVEAKLPMAVVLIDPALTLLRYGLSALTFFIAVAASYYVLPNIRQKWMLVAPGAFLVVLAWMAGAELFAEYLTVFSQINLVYGSLAGIIVAMLFIYIMAIIYIWGAEFNYQLAKWLEIHVTPKEKIKKSR